MTPVAVRRGFVDVPGGQVHYREAGDGTERVGMCFLVREALLSMLGAVAEARAAKAETY